MELLITLLVVIVLFIVGGALLGAFAAVLWYLLIGLFIGAIARLFVRGTGGLGILRTALYGAVGSLAGGVIAQKLLHGGSLLQFVVSVVVAAILIAYTVGRDR